MTPKGKKRLFVLDTNVLLHDHTCIYHFEEHDVVLPIVVLEELDKFKKGNDSINAQAREFIRELDSLSGDNLFTKGVPLGSKRGRLFVIVEDPKSDKVSNAFSQAKPDNRILALAEQLSREKKDREVILVSKDINLRLKAKSIGVLAQDYKTDKIPNINDLYTGSEVCEDFDPALISRLYEKPYTIGGDSLPHKRRSLPHKYYIFKNGSSSALAHYNAEEDVFERVFKKAAYGIEPRNAEQTFTMDALLRPEIQLLAITGKAGTGKTLLALAAALEQRREFRQIFLARPIVPLGNRDLGFLPGDIKSKLDPYMQPLFDNLGVIRHQFTPTHKDNLRITEMLDQEKLFIAPLAYIRGRSLDKIFFIVDEAQNLTPHEVKTIITRAGGGTKIVFTGDINQIDTPYLDSQSNGLTYLVDRMKGQRLFAHVNLFRGERSELADLASNLL
jgi:PhoH-like ATPase